MDEFPIQKGERTVRFGCGAIFGFAITFLFLLRETSMSSPEPKHWIQCVVGAVIAGGLAAWLGDRFWSRIDLWWRHW